MTKPIFTLVLLLFSYNVLLSQAEPIPDSRAEKAESYLKILQKHYADGDYQLHKAYSDSLLIVAKKYEFSKMHVLALVNQAVYFNNRNERLKSIELYHEALIQCERIPEESRVKAIVLVNMGNTYNNIGFYDKAITTMEKVVAVTPNFENSDSIRAAALIGLANNYAELENYEKTLEYAKKANTLGTRIQNKTVIQVSFNSIIDAYLNTKDYDNALLVGQEALQSITKKPTKSRGWLLLNIGTANYYNNELDIALKHLKESLAIGEEKQLSEIEMRSHEYLAKVYEAKKDYKASYASQKRYSELIDKFSEDRKAATTADLKKDISSKEETINESNQELLAISNKGKSIVIGATLLVVSLSIVLFIYIKRKKKIEAEQLKLQAQYIDLKQNIANKADKVLEELPNTTSAITAETKSYKNSSLTETDRTELKSELLTYMVEEKPYLNPELNQSDLATELGISSQHFSEVLHFGFEQNFYNFINSYRIIEAQKLMTDKKYKGAKIIAVAFDSGFKSKTSFNRVFKKHTGKTPSEYKVNS